MWSNFSGTFAEVKVPVKNREKMTVVINASGYKEIIDYGRECLKGVHVCGFEAPWSRETSSVNVRITRDYDEEDGDSDNDLAKFELYLNEGVSANYIDVSVIYGKHKCSLPRISIRQG